MTCPTCGRPQLAERPHLHPVVSDPLNAIPVDEAVYSPRGCLVDAIQWLVILAILFVFGTVFVFGFAVGSTLAAPRPSDHPDATRPVPASVAGRRTGAPHDAAGEVVGGGVSSEPTVAMRSGAPLELVTRTGVLSHMGAGRPADYLALPIGPGHRVELLRRRRLPYGRLDRRGPEPRDAAGRAHRRRERRALRGGLWRPGVAGALPGDLDGCAVKPVRTASSNMVYVGPTADIGDLHCERLRPGVIRSIWWLSPAEREAIAAGANVSLTIMGEPIPPVSLHLIESQGVGEDAPDILERLDALQAGET